MAEHDRAATALVLGGLVLGALGQFILVYQRKYAWDGVLSWGAGILLLGLALRRSRRNEQRSGRERAARRGWLASVQEHPLRVLLAVGGLALSLVCGLLARQRSVDASFADLLVLWGIGVASFVAAFVPFGSGWAEMFCHPIRDGGLWDWLVANQVELGGLVALLVLALVLRAYDLEHIPANLGGDEGTQGSLALELVRPPMGNPFATGWFSVPTMSFLVYGLSMRIFGATVGGLRTLSAVTGTATVLSTYLLARELWGMRVAWLSSTALAGGHYHIHFSRLGSNQIFDPLVMTVALWLLMLGMRHKEPVIFALTGVVVGLGWYGYFGARLVGVVVAGYLVLQATFRHRFLARYAQQLAVLGGGALVAVAPLVLHYAAHPDALASRPRQVSIFASGWLAREQEITGRGALMLLFQQFWKSVSAFNYTLDPSFWYRASIPLLDFISGLLFVIGIVWVIARWRWPLCQLLLAWFWLALLTGWVMTENPPSSQRMITAAPALALFFGLGLDWTIGVGMRAIGGRAALCSGVAVVVLAAVAALNLGYYFISYTPTRVYGNPTAEMATHLSQYLAQRSDDCVVHLHGSPWIYWDFGTLQFMAPGVVGVDVPRPGEGERSHPDLAQGTCFVFHRARADELAHIRAEHPGGTETYVRSRSDGDLLYAMYEVRRE